MLCSERELGLSDEHDGIIDLAADAPVGVSYAAYAEAGPCYRYCHHAGPGGLPRCARHCP